MLELLLAPAIVALGCTVQGSFGFGLGLVAAPTLVLINPEFAPAPLLTNGLVLTGLLTLRERRSMDVRGVGWAITGRLPGVILGAAVLTIVSAKVLGIGFGLLILLGVGMSAIGPRLPPSVPVLTTAGFISGFMATTVGVGGPPLALVYQHAPGEKFRSTLSGYFLIGIALSLVALAVVGEYGRVEARLAAVLLPGTMVGFYLSGHFVRRVSNRVVRPAVLALSAIAAVVVILRQIL